MVSTDTGAVLQVRAPSRNATASCMALQPCMQKSQLSGNSGGADSVWHGGHVPPLLQMTGHGGAP